MITTPVGRTLFLLGACALLESIGCGAPPPEEPAAAARLQQRQQALVSGPDYTIESVFGPEILSSGAPLGGVNVVVCNQGDATNYSDAVYLNVHLSSDNEISTSDTLLAQQYVGWMMPGDCGWYFIAVDVWVPDGAWYLGAHVFSFNNPDADVTNDSRVGNRISVGSLPDFSIQTVSGPAIVRPGEPFTTSVAVCNHGTAAGSTDVQLVLSADTSIRYSPADPPAKKDLPLSAFTVGPLAAGQCETQQVQASVQPAREGVWYLGAVADPTNAIPEHFENNNARASKAVGIGNRPDFTVQTVSGPATLGMGAPFTASVKVCNPGTVAGSTDVQLVLSQDTTIRYSPSGVPGEQDLPVTAFSVGPVDAGQCVTQQVQASAQPPQEGTWYLGAVADPANAVPELFENNNTRASKAVGIGNRPDFAIQAVRGPSIILPGAAFAATVTVCNPGTGAGSAEVQLVLSQDNNIQFDPNGDPYAQDLPLASFSSGMLEPGQCSTQQVQTHAPGSLYEVRWYLGAVADFANAVPEFIESNNERAGTQISIGYISDIAVQSMDDLGGVAPNTPFMVKAQVCNRGNVSEFVAVWAFLSSDTEIDFSDTRVGEVYVGTLMPGKCTPVEIASSTWTQAGTWYPGVFASSAFGGFEDYVPANNARAAHPIQIGYIPDYVIQEVSGPATLTPGAPFTASVTVCNQGTMAGATDVQLVLSEDTTIQFVPGGAPAEQDLPLASFSAGLLAPGQCVTQQVQASAQPPHEGVWYLGAVADPANSTQESIETNNTRASAAVGIGHRPDYLIQAVSSPPSVLPGVPFMASVTVCNHGTVSGPGPQVQLVLSEDSTIHYAPNSPPLQQDLPLTTFTVEPLAAGQCVTQQVQASVQPPHEGTWYLGAVADPANAEAELIETNNARASKGLGIGHLPDYVIQAVSAPRFVEPGASFTVAVTVCNQGTVAGDTDVRMMFSEDGVVHIPPEGPYPFPEPPASFSSGPLEPGQCTTQQLQLPPPPYYEGTWYVGATADPSNFWPEFFETNNSRASKPIIFEYRPDFIVKAVSGPPSVAPGAPFTASVTVCNQGNYASYTDVELVLSQDTTIRFASDVPPAEQDLPLGSLYTNYLEPGQCETQQVQVSAQPPHEGTWYLGAVADPWSYTLEFDETNNTRASAPMGIGFQPDYSIQAVTGPVSLLPGQPFTASVKVCNSGTADGDGADVQLVLSEDATIRFVPGGAAAEQDLPLGSFASGPLAAGQCMTQQLAASAPIPHDGTWYLGAVVNPDGSAPEFLLSNNTRASKPIGVGLGPDYLIQAVSGPVTTLPDSPFTVKVTVCNHGTASGAGTQVQLVLSEDTAIHFVPGEPLEGQDSPLGSFDSGPLAAGQCVTQQVQASAQPPHEGAWYLGAVANADGSAPELLQSNNTRASKPMGIGNRPDFFVEAVTSTVDVTRESYLPVQVTVCNQGTTSGSPLVALVLSQDTTLRVGDDVPPDAQDLVFELVYPGPLEPGQCSTQHLITYASPWQSGAWYLGAIADPWNEEPELLEANNARIGDRMGFGDQPDFVIQTVSAPASVTPGAAFTASVTACNHGTVEGSTQVWLVLSEDSSILFSSNTPLAEQDLPLDSFSTGSLMPGQCTTRQVQLTAQVPHDGTWFLGAIADPDNSTVEFFETNNARASKPVGIGYGPDYVLESINGPASFLPGELLTASVTVCNHGTTSSAGTQVQLVLSEDSSIRFVPEGDPQAQDLPLASFASGALAVGQCKTQQVQLSVQPPHEGAWYLGAVADPANAEAELVETNNARASKSLGIGSGPDYVIQSITGPASAIPWEPFLVKATVCNQGTASGTGTQVQLVLSADTTIRFSTSGPPMGQDRAVGAFHSGPLQAGQCVTQQLEASGLQEVLAGAWYLGAVADPAQSEPELLESNNARASDPIYLGVQPDFVVQSISSPAIVRPGEYFLATGTVCNQGTLAYGAYVQLVLSQDTDIRFVEGQQDNDEDLGALDVGYLEPGQCITRSWELIAWHEGTWYLGAIARNAGWDPEFSTANNARAGNLIGIGHLADYVIQSVSGPASLLPGEPFTAAVTVCNQGTEAGNGADGVLLLSEDASIHFAPEGGAPGQDALLATFSSGPLAAGQCATQQLPLSGVQVAHTGTWYLGAVVDPGSTEPELIEANNARASKPIGIGQGRDYLVQAVSGPASILPGEPFSASVTVCNQGNEGGDGAQVQLVLSENASIRFAPEGDPQAQDLPLASFASGPLAAGGCMTQQVLVSGVQVSHEGAWYLGAVVDPGNSEAELVELNNSRASKALGIGNAPDFLVQAVSAPASAVFGEPLTTSLTVCNQGTASGETEVGVLLSADTDIRYSPYLYYSNDELLNSFFTGTLEPGQCMTQELQLYLWPPSEGTWHLGATADLNNMWQELLKTNNSRASSGILIHYQG